MVGDVSDHPFQEDPLPHRGAVLLPWARTHVGASEPRAEQTEVVLRADGRDYPLSVPGGLVLDPNRPGVQGGGRWVAVEGEPTDLEVRVTVDGVTQVVDASDGSVEAGQAADLDALPSPEEVQLALRTPYVDGIGWARTGREFLVVHVIRPWRLSLSSGRGDSTRYWDSTVRFAAGSETPAPRLRRST